MIQRKDAAAGNLFLIDIGVQKVWKVGTDGRLTIVAGSTRGFSGDGGPATEALKAARLNAADDALDRWARECTVRAFRPFGTPLEAPGSYPTTSGAAPVPPSDATTATWRPWHWRGRPRRRRGNRLPDDG